MPAKELSESKKWDASSDVTPILFFAANLPLSSLFDFPHPWEDHARLLLRESNPSLLLRLLRKRPENPDSKSQASSGMTSAAVAQRRT